MLGWLSERFARQALGVEEPEPKLKKRDYAGASTGRLFSSWKATTLGADSEIEGDLEVLRDRSRELCRNHPYAKKFLRLIEVNTVGEKGLTLQVRARNATQGNNQVGALDINGNALIENNFKRWSSRCDVTGRLSWIDSQNLAVRSLARDGECLIRFVYGSRWKDGFALQFFEADYLDHELTGKAKNGNQIRMGVELDKFQVPTAYYLLSNEHHPNDVGAASHISRRKHIRIPADEMLHLYFSDRSQQNRGVPWMAPSMAKFKLLDGYEEAELVAARVGAAAMAFGSSSEPDAMVGDEFDGSDQIMDLEPGTFRMLPPGVSLQSFDPAHPTSAFADFHKAVLRGIASGLGVSYVSLANNFQDVSYSSVRAATIEDRDFYRTLQTWLIEHFALPIYRKWLESALQFGDLRLPLDRYNKFADAATFTARGWQWVDPAKEIKAHVDALNNGFVSLSDIQRQYGRDPEDVFAALQTEKILAERYGIQWALEPIGDKKPADVIFDADTN